MASGIRVDSHEQIKLRTAHFDCTIQVSALELGVELELLGCLNCGVHPLKCTVVNGALVVYKGVVYSHDIGSFLGGHIDSILFQSAQPKLLGMYNFQLLLTCC